MSKPVDIDNYTELIVLNDEQLAERQVQPQVLKRLHRLRGLYAYWLQYPDKFDCEIVEYNVALNGVKRTQAYDDLHLLQVLMGSLQRASKDFMRWKINKDLEYDLKMARRAGDWRSVAAIEKQRIANNRTDKEDEVEISYDNIRVGEFEFSDSPALVGMQRMTANEIRAAIKRNNKKYSRDIEDAVFVEMPEEESDE